MFCTLRYHRSLPAKHKVPFSDDTYLKFAEKKTPKWQVSAIQTTEYSTTSL